MQITPQQTEYVLNLLDSVVNSTYRFKILEIGVWTGSMIIELAKWAYNNGGYVYGIDPFTGKGSGLQECKENYDIEHIARMRLNELDLNRYVNILRGKSHEFSKEFANNSFDLIFVDGDHRYSWVKKDLHHWWPKIRKGGIFCGHDCEGTEYNENHINEDCIDNVHHGVIKAVTQMFPEAKIENGIWSVQK